MPDVEARLSSLEDQMGRALVMLRCIAGLLLAGQHGDAQPARQRLREALDAADRVGPTTG